MLQIPEIPLTPGIPNIPLSPGIPNSDSKHHPPRKLHQLATRAHAHRHIDSESLRDPRDASRPRDIGLQRPAGRKQTPASQATAAGTRAVQGLAPRPPVDVEAKLGRRLGYVCG